MMPSGIAMGILNPVAGKMYDRIGGRPLALLGFAIMTHRGGHAHRSAGSGGIGHWRAGFVPHGRHCVRGLFGCVTLHS